MSAIAFTRAEAAELGLAALTRRGAGGPVAERIVATLIDNEAEGHASHGLMRIADYVEDHRSGRLRLEAVPEIIGAPAPAVRHVDARHAPAPVVADMVTECLAALVAEQGVGLVGVRNAHHLGRLSGLGRRLAGPPHKLAAIGFCNFQGLGPRQGPPGGGGATLCTNPLLIAVPLENDEAYILDMSTTVVSEGQVRQARDGGGEAPGGWLVDRENRPVREAASLYGPAEDASLMTSLGYPYAAHKGFGLALAAELLIGAIGGGHTVADPGAAGNSLVLIAMAGEAAGPRLAADILVRALPGGQRWPGRRKPHSDGGELLLPEALVASLRALAGGDDAG